MKTFLTATMALAVLASAGAASAQPYNGDRRDDRRQEQRYDRQDERRDDRWVSDRHRPRRPVACSPQQVRPERPWPRPRV